METGKIKLAIADDHTILLDGLRALLQKQKDMEITGMYSNGQELLDDLDRTQPDVVLADINMPVLNGYELTLKIKRDHPGIRVVILSMHDDAGHIMELIEAGASGYLLKNVNDKELLDAIRMVHAGRMYFSAEVSEKITTLVLQQRRPEKDDGPRLTARETEILKHISREYNNAAIASALFISERTVETHRKNMMRKTNNKTIVGLLRYAMEHKLI